MRRFAARVSYGAFGSEIVFGALDGFIERRAFAAGLEWRASPEVTVQLGGGVGHGGRLVVEGVHHEMLPGWLATAAGSWRVLGGPGRPAFTLLTLTLGASGARTREIGAEGTEGYLAIDGRLGAAFGYTLFDALSPYAAARVFGGPILWRFRGESQQGTDRYHYQVALGLSAALPGGFDVMAEGAPIGERGATVGIGKVF